MIFDGTPNYRNGSVQVVGQTSDHTQKEDAIREMAAFDCSLHGTTVAKLEKERLLRAQYLSKQRKQAE